MTATDKPSIAELQRMHEIVLADDRPQHIHNAALAVLTVFTPVLLEIAAAALDRAAAIDKEDWDLVHKAQDRLRAALAKVTQ